MRRALVLRSIVAMLIGSLVMGSSSLAQSFAPPPDGITAIGYGQASADADTSTLQITISTESFGPMSAPQPGATPGAEEREQIQPVIDALVNAGLAEEDITIVVPPFLANSFSGPYGPAVAFVEVTVDSPTSDLLRNLITAAAVGASEAGLVTGTIEIYHAVTDCSALIQEAEQSAFENAQQRAMRQADIVGVSLGDVTAVRDNVLTQPGIVGGIPAAGDEMSCQFSRSSVISYTSYGPLPYDLTMDPVVIVSSTTEVTFGIEDEPTATPAS